MIIPRFILCLAVFGFSVSLRLTQTQKGSLSKRFQVATPIETTQNKNPLEELIENILRALPEVLAPAKEMNPEKVVPSPKAFSKPQSATRFHKTISDGWKVDDIASDFAARYGVLEKTNLKKSVQLADLLDELDEMELLDSLDEYMPLDKANGQDPLTAAEKFVTEAVVTGFAPIDRPMNPSKVITSPRKFVKPVKLSALKKVLGRNKHYFD